MFGFEWIALLYFAALLLVALSRGRRTAAVAAAMLIVAIVAAAAALPVAARQWFGHFYLMVGYWLPAWIASTGGDRAFEEWLIRRDAYWQRVIDAVPAGLAAAGDVAYFLCFPLVPLSFLLVWSAGSATDVDRYWTGVLLAGFACYGTLPWLVSRPPRLLQGNSPSAALARGNAWVLARISHGRNTFPSGHVAVSIAAAMAVGSVSPGAGAIAGAVAAGVALGAATGRYHFVIDVVAGMVTGVACGGIAWLVSA